MASCTNRYIFLIFSSYLCFLHRSANTAELEALKATLADAEQNQGEMEVLDALFAISKFHSRIGAKADAYLACDAIILKPKVCFLFQNVLIVLEDSS